jgi:hypothetical protein
MFTIREHEAVKLRVRDHHWMIRKAKSLNTSRMIEPMIDSVLSMGRAGMSWCLLGWPGIGRDSVGGVFVVLPHLRCTK